jgi:riboflavin synthase|tara:strand:- start:462 stop:1067 length:606 start_codon:yes stop_codon:yes gene_type:complete
MFTGIIESVGTVTSISGLPKGLRVRIDTHLASDLIEGESIAVNGVCLTAVSIDPGSFAADVSPETARVTAVAGLKTGSTVNLERSLSANGRFGGHVVQGHIDDVGVIIEIVREADFWRLKIGYPEILRPYIVYKGAIAIDGISLTVAQIGQSEFDVQIVPFTWEHTNLNSRSSGGQVNLECDIIGKYVAHMLKSSYFEKDV